MKPTIQLLDDSKIAPILHNAQRILGEIGVEVRGRKLRQLLLDRGLRADPATGRIRFPLEVVASAVATAPPSFTLFDREGTPQAEIGGDRVHFCPGSSALNILDHRTGQTRPATTLDYVEYVRVADSLPHLSYLATAFSAADVPPPIADAWRLYLHLLGSRKPLVSGAFGAHGVPRMAEMMALFRRSRADLVAHPLAIFTVTATGHFRYGEDSCENLIDCVEWGIPVEFVPVTLMGLIAPVTVREATAFHVADVLAGITMAQLIRPGAPVLFGGAPATFHMQHTTSPMAAVEAMHLTLAYAAVGRHLGLPTQAYLALGDGKLVDAQAGAESFGGALLAVLAGINAVSGPGLLDFALVFSLAKLVVDDELCGQALHLKREAAMDAADDAVSLARELLADGHLLTAKHTRRHWHHELYLPGEVWDRRSRDAWQAGGAPTLLQRASAEVERRLTTYKPVETDERVSAELRRILATGLEPHQSLPALPPFPRGAVDRRAMPAPRRHRTRRRTDPGAG